MANNGHFSQLTETKTLLVSLKLFQLINYNYMYKWRLKLSLQPLDEASKNFHQLRLVLIIIRFGVAFISSIPTDLLWVLLWGLYNDTHNYNILSQHAYIIKITIVQYCSVYYHTLLLIQLPITKTPFNLKDYCIIIIMIIIIHYYNYSYLNPCVQ